MTQETALTTTTPSLPCDQPLTDPCSAYRVSNGAYLLAVQTTVVGSDGEELVTSDGETAGLDRGRVLEASCQTADLLRRDLNVISMWESSKGIVNNGRGEASRQPECIPRNRGKKPQRRSSRS